MKLIRLFASGLKNGFVAIGALAFLGGALAIADYAVTQGAGTNFGSKIIGGIHFAEQLICDFTTGGQCATVTAANALKVDGSAVTQPVSGTVTANQGTSPWIVSNPNAQQVLQGTTPWIVSSQTGFGGGSGGSVTQGTSPWVISGQVSISNGSDVNAGSTADAAASVGAAATMAAKLRLMTSQLDNINTNVQSSVPAGTNTIGNAGLVIPAGATAESASATGTTGATTATLATAVGKTTYICGMSIRANADAAATGNATVTGTITGTLNFTQWTAPNTSGLGVTEQIFVPCLPASTTNTSIAVISAAPGTGGVVSVSAWGFQL